MFDQFFWDQFWAEFLGGMAATLFIAALTAMLAYFHRFRLGRLVRRAIDHIMKS